MAKQSSNALSRLASRIMKGARATRHEIMQLAASVLSQDETRGNRKTKRKKKRKSKRKSKARKTPVRATKKRRAKKRK